MRRALVAALLVLITAPSAGAAERGVAYATGGDSRPCATYREFNLLGLGQTHADVRRILDTPGRRVTRATYMAAFGSIEGLDLSGMPRSGRERYRSYPTCAEDGVPSVLMVEFDSARGTSASLLWD